MRAFLVLALLGLMLPREARAAVPPTETAKIDALLGSIGALPDAVFVRNGRDYDAATAEKFLRAKWDRRRADIATAREFIAKIASVSSTIGQPYRIRFKDGREVLSGEFLGDRLAALEARPSPPQK